MNSEKPSQVTQGARPAIPQWLWLAVGLLVAVRLVFWAFTRLTIEDSLISLRYAENLARGFGLVYNPGERVFGASTPIHVLLLAGLTKVGLPALFTVKLLAISADAATGLLWGQRLLRETGRWTAPVVFLLLFGLSPLVVPVTISGMETSFALLLITLSLLAATTERSGRRDWVALGLPLGLLMLVRPDGAILTALVLSLRWWRTRRLPFAPAALAALVVLPWVLVSWKYYGSFIPHSIPAKTAAYNMHRRTIWPNFWATVGEMAPVGGPWWRIAVSALVFPGLAVGLWHGLRESRMRPLALLLPVWWAYLVFPKTLLFTWYFPLLVLPAYALTGLGYGILERAVWRSRPLPMWVLRPAVAALGVFLCCSLAIAADGWRRAEHAERTVREAVGVWLRENTPEDARIAMEPIGYIGYYSGRRILDEVGLVSPEMVPLNRRGGGWFSDMLDELHPDYIVERPGYLLRNRTLNSGVPLFRNSAERDGFLARYEPVITFDDPRAPNPQDYRFVIYRRRSAESAEHWASVNGRLGFEEQEELRVRSLIGPVDLRTLTALDASLKAAPAKLAPKVPLVLKTPS